jgi:hypothetical protein
LVSSLDYPVAGCRTRAKRELRAEKAKGEEWSEKPGKATH